MLTFIIEEKIYMYDSVLFDIIQRNNFSAVKIKETVGKE